MIYWQAFVDYQTQLYNNITHNKHRTSAYTQGAINSCRYVTCHAMERQVWIQREKGSSCSYITALECAIINEMSL